METDKEFWDDRYVTQNTRWDLGKASAPIKRWFDSQANKKIKVLIPGAGRGHEIEYPGAKDLRTCMLLIFRSIH